MLETPRELAIRLLGRHKAEIAHAVYKLACKLHPAWGAVEEDAFSHNTEGLLVGIAGYLQGGDDDVILKLARNLMKVRKLAGFSAVDFNVLLHVYLPVLRKALLARAPTVRQGLAAYDACEAVLLPLVTRLLESSAQVDSITTPDAQPAFHGRAFEEVSVDGEIPEFMLAEYADFDDEDDSTDPARRR